MYGINCLLPMFVITACLFEDISLQAHDSEGVYNDVLDVETCRNHCVRNGNCELYVWGGPNFIKDDSFRYMCFLYSQVKEETIYRSVTGVFSGFISCGK